MFIGHYAVGLAAKRVAPTQPLGTLFLACQLPDLLWPTLLLAGLERVEVRPGDTAMTPLAFVSYPYSHSLIGVLLQAATLGLVVRVRRGRGAARSAAIVALVVVSHWVLDALTHRPDLPLTFSGDTRIGLGLWNSVTLTLVLEGAMFLGGVLAYITATRGVDRIGAIGFWSLIGFLLIVYVANVSGPPPPSAGAVSWAAHLLWVVVGWAYWVDRHRPVRPIATEPRE